jgi:hypothetical protein
MSEVDLRGAAAPKSDQLNADDLIGASLTFTVTSVSAGNREQPVVISHDAGRPYKPCKGMIRVLMLAWGDKGSVWVGKSMTVFNDPTVTWAGVEVGGIRISHVSHIKHSISTSVTMNKKQRKPYRVDPLVIAAPAPPAAYPAAQFTEKLPAMIEAMKAGKMTAAQVIAHCEKTGTLTDKQKALIVVPAADNTNDEEEQM